MKRFGNIMFCFVPFLLAFGIQLAVSLPVTGLAVIYICYSNMGVDSITLYDFVSKLQNTLLDSNFNVLISLIYGITALFVFGFWYFKKYAGTCNDSIKRSPKSFLHPAMFVALFLLAISLQYNTSYVITFVSAIKPSWLEYYTSLMDSVGFNDMTLILFVYSIFVAPMCEELIFRGVTLHHAQRFMPFWLANIFQAVLFGVMHMNMIQGIYAFFIGLFLGYICVHGGSIYLSILLHMMFNFIGSYLPDFGSLLGGSNIAYTVVALASIAVTIGALMLYNHGIQMRDQQS